MNYAKRLCLQLLLVILLSATFCATALAQQPATVKSVPSPQLVLDGKADLALLAQVTKDINNIFEELDQSLDPIDFEDSPGMYKKALECKVLLPEFQAYILKAYASGSKGPLSVLRMAHPSIFVDPDQNTELRTRASQNQVYTSLVELHPDLLAVEGTTAAVVTLDSLTDESLDSYHDNDRFPERNIVTQYLQVEIQKFGFLKYALEHAEIRTMGAENSALHSITVFLSKWEHKIAKSDNVVELVTVRRLVSNLQRLRSHLALAKLLTEAKQRSAKNPVLVMGSGHGNDIIRAMLAYGIAGKIYETKDALASN